MTEIKYAFSNFDIIIVVDGKATTVGLSHVNYLPICKALQAGNLEQAIGLLDVKTAVENVYADNGLVATVTEDKSGSVEIEIGGHKLTGEIANIFTTFRNAKLPVTAIIRFWKKFMANAKLGGLADYERRQALLRFLVRNKLVLTPSGNFIAFKGVRTPRTGEPGVYRSCHKESFCYELNKTAVEPAAQEITDIGVACGVGLHAGSIDYAKSYGNIRLAVEIDPSDVVTVPNNNDNHLRCWRLTPRTVNPDDSAPVSSFLRLDVDRVEEMQRDQDYAPPLVSAKGPRKSRGGGRTKKTTWYKLVGGKVIRERKVVCPGTGWSPVMPTVTGARGKTVKAKVVTPKGAESMRTYYQADPYAEQPNNVKTTRASKCPPGWTGTRPPWFSKKK